MSDVESLPDIMAATDNTWNTFWEKLNLRETSNGNLIANTPNGPRFVRRTWVNGLEAIAYTSSDGTTHATLVRPDGRRNSHLRAKQVGYTSSHLHHSPHDTGQGVNTPRNSRK